MIIEILSTEVASLNEFTKDQCLLIDVREPFEFQKTHLAGAINIPLGELGEYLNNIKMGYKLFFICKSGKRSLQACHFASSLGYNYCHNLQGGMLDWQEKLLD